MLEKSEPAEFLVADHFEITGRGGVVLGKILRGVFRAGMLASGASGFPPIKITSAEFLRGSNPNTPIGLAFREHLGLQALRAQFPVGSVLTAQEPAASGSTAS